jgi:hypothetical protein
MVSSVVMVASPEGSVYPAIGGCAAPAVKFGRMCSRRRLEVDAKFSTLLPIRAKGPGGAEGDRYQLNLETYGPSLTAQGSSSAYSRLDAVWQHPIGGKWALVLTATDLLGSTGGHYETVISTLRSRNQWPADERAVKLALSWKFGGRGWLPLPIPLVPAKAGIQAEAQA